MTGNNLDACLKQFSLEKYLSNFKSRGINGRKELASLTMQDYPSLGITSMKDREKLFHLIQNLKAAEENEKSKTSRQNEVKGEKSKLSCKVPTEQRESTDKYKSHSKKRSTGSVSQSPATPAIANTESPHKPTKCASISRSKSGIVTVEDGYNYGVPSSKPKLSLAKKSSALPTDARIRVCVRKRPLSVEERQMGEFDIVEVTGTDVVTVYAPKVSVDLSKYTQTYPFVFDEAFDEYCTNEDVYTRTAQPLVKTVFNGGKATCFCYGCTGSGKTYTMLGNDTVQGLYLLATKDIFSTLQSQIGKASLWVSFFEIYCGQLFDLLNGRTKLHARENANHQVCINGLTEQEVLNVEQLMDLIDYGNTVRSTGSTGVNADSSRSHAILQLEVKTDGGTKPAGRFSFIDLAGSERAADVTDTDRQTRMEGAEINQSLLALKECIRALDQDSKHTPFRQSKLTQVLKDSFIGDSHTCMIANISPNMSSSENTLNTLRYADRAKELRRMDVQSPRPATAAKTDFNFWSEEKIMNTKSNKNLPKLKIEEIKKETHSRDLSKALEKINMSDFEKLGNIRPNTTSDLDSQQTTSIAAGHIARVQTLKVPKLRKGAGLSQSYNLGTTPLNQLTATARPVTSPAATPSKSKGGAKRLLKPHSRNTVMKRNNYLLPSANIKRNKDVILEEVNMKAEKERESGNSQFVFSKVSETEVKVPLASNNLSMMSKSKLTPSKGTSGRELNQLSLNTKPSNVLGKSSSSTSNVAETLPPKTDEVSPPLPNTRYNNRSFKARLSRLFNSKSSELAPPATGNTKGPIAKSKPDLEEIKVPHSLHDVTRMKTYPLLTREHEHLTLTQEQIIAAHHTQLALTTGLCQEEMVLLRKVDSKDQSFSDYINQLEDILLQKATSIDTLRRKLASYSKR